MHDRASCFKGERGDKDKKPANISEKQITIKIKTNK